MNNYIFESTVMNLILSVHHYYRTTVIHGHIQFLVGGSRNRLYATDSSLERSYLPDGGD